LEASEEISIADRYDVGAGSQWQFRGRSMKTVAKSIANFSVFGGARAKLSPHVASNLLMRAQGALRGLTKEFLAMCDYSLQGVASRPAKVGDKLTTRNFGTGTRGFAASEERTTAVCLLPGTEIAFAKEIAIESPRFFGRSIKSMNHTTAIFRQVNKETPHVHHDSLEFPDGQMVLLTELCEGQEATVLQLPAQPATAIEAEAQKRAVFIG
jgi:hypothetical protein